MADQRRECDLLLNWLERLIRRREESPELGWGRLELIETTGPVLAHRRTWGDLVKLIGPPTPAPVIR